MSIFAFPSGGSSDMELLFSTTLTSTAVSITTGTLPTGYKSYIINVRLRSDRASFYVGDAAIYFNGDDTDANYQNISSLAVNQSSSPSVHHAQTPHILSLPTVAGDASFFSNNTIEVHNPETTTGFKGISVSGGAHAYVATSSNFSRLATFRSGVWRNTAAITTITIQSVAVDTTDGAVADFEVGSFVAVYGLK